MFNTVYNNKYRSSGHSRSGRFSGRNKYYNKRSNRRSNKEPISFDRYIAKAVDVEIPSIYVEDAKFSDFDISPSLKKNIFNKKYSCPTKIQNEAIPTILKGNDVLGLASTGSGKTAAFLIPLMNKIIRDRSQRCLIVIPTRELALQIQDEFKELGKDTGLKSVLVIGGNSIRTQIGILNRDPQFIIATPGRLKDVSERRAINLERINNVVLDEVDRMLDMGFIEDIKYITSKLNKDRQSLFFSATMSPKSESVANSLLKNPVKIETEMQSPVKNVEQDVVRVSPKDDKVEILCKILKKEEVTRALIFTRTKMGADRLSKKLNLNGIYSDALHGDKRQSQRFRIIDGFKRGKFNILIATDVASRGLDVSNISHVINFDAPENYDDYIHRIGRTGRAGKKGFALTFI